MKRKKQKLSSKTKQGYSTSIAKTANLTLAVPRPEKTKIEHIRTWFEYVFKKVWSLIVYLGTILGLLAIYSFLPNIEIIPQEIISDINPFEVPIEIKNSSFFSIKDVDVTVNQDSILYNKNEFFSRQYGGSQFNKTKIIRPGESYTFIDKATMPIVTTDNVVSSIVKGSFHITVKYRYLGINRKTISYYSLGFDRNNKAIWLKQPKPE